MRIFLGFLITFLSISASYADNQLKILSWNIYQIPKPILWTNQGPRAEALGDILSGDDHDHDVIFFQEAFSPSARKKIYKKLQNKYPYESGTFKKRGLFKILNSGLWVISRYPIKVLEHTYFSDCKGSDCFATKGSLLVEVDHPSGKRVQIIGSHLQASDEGPRKEYRLNQLRLMRESMDRFKEYGVDQIIVGDLNIDTHAGEHYQDILSILDATDPEVMGNIFYTTGHELNSFSPKKERMELLDYILIRNGLSHSYLHSKTVLRHFYVDKKGREVDLSDHYAVKAILSFE